ncbi:MAG: SWIM zinc finger domain-containing protein [Anaerolineae bacterium]|jgi:hypothetical protein|nr:SWIM zinc finger domain-containing protein [Anaerolineae bacterium]
MDYSMIGKIEKSKKYAEDPSRVTFNSFTLEFKGSNSSYTITLGPDGWHCSCPGFQKYGICPHIMSLERSFGPMLKREPLPYAPGQNVVSDVEKAKQYALEPDRIQFLSFNARFRGDHSEYTINYDNGHWDCDNDYFKSRGICSHTMAMERILKGMVKPLMMPTTES